MSILLTCMPVPLVPGPCGDRKGHWMPGTGEMNAVRHHVGAGDGTWVLCENKFYNSFISPSPNK